MSWISLVCLLALTSSALGRSAYGSGYGTVTIPQPVLPRVFPTINTYEPMKPFVPTVSVGYGTQEKLIPKTLTSYGTPMISPPVLPRTFEPVIPRTFEPVNTYSYGSSSLGRTLPVGPIVLPPTQAEILCRGAEAGSVIPIEGNRKFVVCIGDDKGYEQDCPKGLYYHPESRRCERKLGPLENACVSQPCLNGGQCFPDGSSFQCQCAPGFDGKTCELDATICQTQYPCGQSPDVRCQSFRLGAALPYVCLFSDSTAYGLSQQQIFPSPCGGIDGPQRLAFGNKGFILCDGERLFIESCPGGTIWDDFNKACAWPDQEGVITGPMFEEKSLLEERPIQKESYGSYGTYTQPMPVPTLPKTVVRPTLPKIMDESTSYGGSYTPLFTPPTPVFTPPPRIFETTTPGYEYTQPTVPFTPPTPVFTPPPRIFETTTPGYRYTAPPSIVFTPPTPKIIERPTGYNYGARLISEPMKPRVLTGY